MPLTRAFEPVRQIRLAVRRSATRRADRPLLTDLEALLASWMRPLRARNVSVATQTAYRSAADSCVGSGLARHHHCGQGDRAAVEDWIGSLLETRGSNQ
jgi:hypothetical protein